MLLLPGAAMLLLAMLLLPLTRRHRGAGGLDNLLEVDTRDLAMVGPAALAAPPAPRPREGRGALVPFCACRDGVWGAQQTTNRAHTPAVLGGAQAQARPRIGMF